MSAAMLELGISLPVAPALFIGCQDFPGRAPFPLFNLQRDIPGHPVNSTVSADTLIRAGYAVPATKLSPKK